MTSLCPLRVILCALSARNLSTRSVVWSGVDRWTCLLAACAMALAACHEGRERRELARSSPVGVARAQASPEAGNTDPFAFDPTFFEKKRKPQRGDWLASFHEPGQPFAQYVAQAPQSVTASRHTIVLQPIGSFGKEGLAVMEKLREFAAAFFQLRVRVATPVPLPDHGKRQRGMGRLAWTQYHTGTLMKDVLLPRLPRDAVCYLGITMSDLYPEPAWNFVFGEASFTQRVGVYSLARYTHRFWGRAETDESRRKFLERSFKILAHETGHMFSITHCTANECLMNGSNSLDETDRGTIHLCPVCLHKLHWNLKFDVVGRYRALRAIYAGAGFSAHAGWMKRRLASLGQPSSVGR